MMYASTPTTAMDEYFVYYHNIDRHAHHLAKKWAPNHLSNPKLYQICFTAMKAYLQSLSYSEFCSLDKEAFPERYI